MKMHHRVIIHIDMNAFFASVEQQANPDLRGKPIAVVGGGHRTVITTSSCEARAKASRPAWLSGKESVAARNWITLVQALFVSTESEPPEKKGPPIMEALSPLMRLSEYFTSGVSSSGKKHR